MPSSNSKHRRDKRLPEAQVDHVHLQLESVLRLRPLLKKEKQDQVVLEPRRLQDGRPSTAVIHPMMAKQSHHPESPAMKMLSPETLQLCKDTEYHLNQILADESDQEKVYYTIGLPIARESMDYLKVNKTAKGVRKNTNLIVCIGVENSGKTHTCFGAGNGNVSKRRSSEDGLVPRIIDSLFSQSKHHVKNRRSLSFGVRMSLVQVTQQRTEQPKDADDSVVQDLLLPSLSKAAASPMRSPSPTGLKSVKNLIATLERARASATSSARSQNDSLVTIEQDTKTMDFSTNAAVKTCRDATEARQMLSSGLHAGQKLCSRGTSAHVLTILQPVLLGPDGATEREGGKIGVLDMAGIEQSSQKKRNTAVRRHKDSVGASCSGLNDAALNAVLHCVRSLQHNSMILSGRTPTLDIVDGSYDGITIDDNTSEISCVSQEKNGKAKGPTFKVVPYRQHNLTMLLQPFFSARQTSTAKLTLLMAAYPGHRDHAEKKAMLNDLELLFEVEREPEEGAAVTGFEKRPLSPIQYSPSSQSGDDRSTDKGTEDEPCFSDSDKKAGMKNDGHARSFPSAPTADVSMAYSLDEDDEMIPLPPPFAPTAPPASYPTACNAVPQRQHSTPNAPLVVDFPGVVMPAPKESPYAAPRAVMPHPQELERSFENKPPPKKSTTDFRDDQPLRAITIHNVQNKEATLKTDASSSPTKAWLSGLSGNTKMALNHVYHASAKTGMKMMDKIRTNPERTELQLSNPGGVIPPAQSPDNNFSLTSSSTSVPATLQSQPARGSGMNMTNKTTTPMKSGKMGTVVYRTEANSAGRKVSQPKNENFKRLEKENRELVNRNQELEVRCRSLSAENAELKRRLHGQTQWNKEDEEAWQKTKKQFAAPPLIQPTLEQHLNEVKSTYDCCGRAHVATSQPQFSLSFPSYFRRASELDRRDKDDEAIGSSTLVCTEHSDEHAPEEEMSGEKRKQSNVQLFEKRLESVKRRKSNLVTAVKENY